MVTNLDIFLAGPRLNPGEQPPPEFIGVVELSSGNKIVGWLEDPNEQINSEARIKLRYPLEYMELPTGELTKPIHWIYPVEGIPEEYICDVCDIHTYSLSSKFGHLYKWALNNISKSKIEYKPTIVFKQTAKPQAR